MERLTLDWGLYHGKVWAWRFWYYLHEYHILGYPGGLIDQPDEYFDDINTLSLVRQWLQRTQGVPRLEQDDVIERLKRGDGLPQIRFETRHGRP